MDTNNILLERVAADDTMDCNTHHITDVKSNEDRK